MSVRVAFASHAATVDGKQYDGIGNSLKETLPDIVNEYIYVRHSMDGAVRSEVQVYRDGDIVDVVDIDVISSPSPVRYVSEIRATVAYFSKNPVDVFIGIDPLNALVAVILRKRKKIKKAIFYTPDYSPQRFGNPIINWLYHRIDRYCVKHSDEVWSVSQKIVEIRQDMGLSGDKNKFLPNMPPIKYNKFADNEHDRHQLITSGIIDVQVDYEGMIRAIKVLENTYPDISLTIVGNGPLEGELKKMSEDIGAKDRINFVGRKTLPETLELVSRAGVGLALYTGKWAFNEFGDSTKCREYASYGLPIVSTAHHATVGELEASGSGVVVDLNVDSYVDAVREIFGNYDRYSEKSRKWGERYAGIHASAIRSVINSGG